MEKEAKVYSSDDMLTIPDGRYKSSGGRLVLDVNGDEIQASLDEIKGHLWSRAELRDRMIDTNNNLKFERIKNDIL
jgi:hypothetical protein